MGVFKQILCLCTFSTIGMQANLFAQDIKEASESSQAVKVSARKNKGNVSYKGFLNLQERLIAYMPPEPRVIDYRNRLSFTELSESERDDYDPKSWSVSIVGDSVDYIVPMEKGGYFVLPDLPQAKKEKADLVFNAQTRKNFVAVAWALKFEDNKIPYRAFAQSFDEVKSVQSKIRWYELLNFSEEKKAVFDAMKVCFSEPVGKVLVGEKEVETVNRGRCQFLKFDPEAVAQNEMIRFEGKVDTLTLDKLPTIQN